MGAKLAPISQIGGRRLEERVSGAFGHRIN
jgi:hypothetical protein